MFTPAVGVLCGVGATVFKRTSWGPMYPYALLFTNVQCWAKSCMRQGLDNKAREEAHEYRLWARLMGEAR